MLAAFSITPLGVGDSVSASVAEAVRLVRESGLPNDPWGNPYVYECPGKNNVSSYDIMSMGPDGRAGSEDDITNWQVGNQKR